MNFNTESRASGGAKGTLQALVVRHVAFEDLGTWEQVLEDRGFDVRYVEAGVDEISSHMWLSADVVIVLGGPIGVNDGELYPFLADETEGIRRRLLAEKPTVGVCLGAQLMASALGASVTAAGGENGGIEGRMEIGFSGLSLYESEEPSVLGALKDVEVLHWHGDCFGIPEGAQSLAATPNYPNQAFSVGSWALGLQFHPEFDSRTGEKWLIGHTGDLRAQGVDIVSLRREMKDKGEALAAASRQFFNQWLTAAGFE